MIDTYQVEALTDAVAIWNDRDPDHPHGDGDLTIYADDVDSLAAEVHAMLAAERERIAQAILSEAPGGVEICSEADIGWHDGLMRAARIARGES